MQARQIKPKILPPGFIFTRNCWKFFHLKRWTSERWTFPPACGSSSGGLTPHENKRLFRVARLARYLKQASLPLIAAKLQAIGWFLDTNKNHTRHNYCCYLFIYLFIYIMIQSSTNHCIFACRLTTLI